MRRTIWPQACVTDPWASGSRTTAGTGERSSRRGWCHRWCTGPRSARWSISRSPNRPFAAVLPAPAGRATRWARGAAEPSAQRLNRRLHGCGRMPREIRIKFIKPSSNGAVSSRVFRPQLNGRHSRGRGSTLAACGSALCAVGLAVHPNDTTRYSTVRHERACWPRCAAHGRLTSSRII